MTFSWLNKQGVSSNEGFSLQRIHRFYYRYEEAGRSADLMVEAVKGGEEVFLGPVTRWDEPNPRPLTAEDRDRMRNNVARALDFMRIRYSLR